MRGHSTLKMKQTVRYRSRPYVDQSLRMDSLPWSSLELLIIFADVTLTADWSRLELILSIPQIIYFIVLTNLLEFNLEIIIEVVSY